MADVEARTMSLPQQLPPEEWDIDPVGTVGKREPVSTPHAPSAPEAAVEAPEAAPSQIEAQPLRRERTAPLKGYGRFSDVAAEQQVVGWMLLYPTQIDRVVNRLTGEEFRSPLYAGIFNAMANRWSSGEPADAPALATDFEFADLIDIQGLCEIAAPEKLMDELVELARRRRIARTLTDGLSTLNDASVGMVADGVADSVLTSIQEVSKIGAVSETVARPWHLLARRNENPPDWLIDGLLRERDRLVIVGSEGAGKTTVLRQMAYCAALGIHPFHRRRLKRGRVKVLVVDLENPRDQVSALAAWMERAARHTMQEGNLDLAEVPCWMVEWEGGIDIRRRPDRARLEAEIRESGCELLVIGPLYKLYQKKGSETDEEVTSEVCAILDEWRVRYNLAMIFEHHAPHGYGGKRNMRPVGSSYWLRWPEYGITMQRNKDRPSRWDVGRFRGDRMPVNWPTALDRNPREAWPVTGFWKDGNMGQDDPRLGGSGAT